MGDTKHITDRLLDRPAAQVFRSLYGTLRTGIIRGDEWVFAPQMGCRVDAAPPALLDALGCYLVACADDEDTGMVVSLPDGYDATAESWLGDTVAVGTATMDDGLAVRLKRGDRSVRVDAAFHQVLTDHGLAPGLPADRNLPVVYRSMTGPVAVLMWLAESPEEMAALAKGGETHRDTRPFDGVAREGDE